jgi:small subunit ribosomal protein S15
MPITREARAGLVEKYRTADKDTGSPEVQIALLTERIQLITGHLASHKKDHATRRGLLMLVGKRNTLLKYLARKAPERYQKLIDSLGLRK